MERIGELELLKKLAKKPKAITSAEQKLLDAAAAIALDPLDAEAAYMARQLVQCTLPYRDPGKVAVWKRRNGNLTLSIVPGVDRETGRSFGYPYGTLPRLLLFWITTEAKRTNSRRLELGNSLAEFMRTLGLDPSRGGKRSDATRLRDQMQRLFRAIISFQQTVQEPHRHGQSWLDMQVAPKGELWWNPKQPNQSVLWGSWIELGEDFFKAITAVTVPADMRALRALKRSPMALDLYALLNWLGDYAARKNRSHFIAWELLMQQLGSDVEDVDNFRRKALAALRKVKAVHPGLKIVQEKGGIRVHPSRPAVPHRPIKTLQE